MVGPTDREVLAAELVQSGETTKGGDDLVGGEQLCHLLRGDDRRAADDRLDDPYILGVRIPLMSATDSA